MISTVTSLALPLAVNIDILISVLCIDELHIPVLADPSLVLPSLVHLIYSSDERLQSSASDACVGMLKYHSQNAEVICMLLDCLRYLPFHFIVFSSCSQSLICLSCYEYVC